MKIFDRLVDLIERKLEDPDEMAKIRTKIIAPSIAFLQSELTRADYNDMIKTFIQPVAWPVFLMIGLIVLLLIVILNLQVYALIRSWGSTVGTVGTIVTQTAV